MLPQRLNSQKSFYYFFAVVSITVFIIVGIRCATIPFCNDEAATFFYYILPGNFLPYHSFISANNHILNSCLSWVCFELFGSSPFSLRLPNLLALLVLIFATFRLSKQVTHLHSKLVLVAGFLLSFHWLSFYSACRGYGISMSFLLLGISYLNEYFNSMELKKLFLFYLFLQIAFAANLILVIVAIVITLAIVAYQSLNKELFKRANIIILFFHIVLIFYWVRFSLFLQANNTLYLGEGESYWSATFTSLVQLIIGIKANWVLVLAIVSFMVLVISTVTINFTKIKANSQNLFQPSIFYLLLLIGMIFVFLGIKKILHVNYPVERIGLFFYVFFILAVVFLLEQFDGVPAKALGYLILTMSIIHFALNINFNKHSSRAYVTFPERFYIRLLEEQKLSTEKLSIGGTLGVKFVYDFWNYRHGDALTSIDTYFSYKICTDCDYVIGWDLQEPYYKPYYDRIDSEKDWGLVLFKRKGKMKRN